MERNDKSIGWVKGEYKFFASPGHVSRLPHKPKKPVRYLVDNITGCWNWLLKIDRKGYGRFTKNGKSVIASREYYKLFKGELLPNQTIDHLCCNTKCVNPDHLEAVSQKENTRRKKSNKLSMEKAKEIRLQASRGETLRSLGKAFGVHCTTILAVVKKEAWYDHSFS